MAIFSRKPKRSVPEPVKPPQHGAPNPHRQEPDKLASFRGQVLGTTGLIFGLAFLAYAIYGPWFAVRTVTVSGTREIAPTSVKDVTDDYLAQWRYGLVPNKNLWLLSRSHLRQTLEKKIRARISIEEVRIIKKNRHALEVVVIERTPVAIWKADVRQGSIDRTGTIINEVTDLAGLPLIVDSGAKQFATGQQVLTEQAMADWLTLNDTLTISTLSVDQYLIPIPTCPTTIITAEEQAEQANRNANEENPNVNTGNTNIEPVNDNTNEATNENQNTNGSNTNTFAPIVVPTDCDIPELAKSSQEIHVKLKDGPLVLFDRHQDLPLAVQTVKRLLANPDNNGATYIDIRFQERVYIK